MVRNDGAYEHAVSEACEHQYQAIDGRGSGIQRRTVCDPMRREGDEGEPEEQVQIRPEHRSADALDGMHQMVMVAPVNANKDKAQDVGQEDGLDVVDDFPKG